MTGRGATQPEPRMRGREIPGHQVSWSQKPLAQVRDRLFSWFICSATDAGLHAWDGVLHEECWMDAN